MARLQTEGGGLLRFGIIRPDGPLRGIVEEAVALEHWIVVEPRGVCLRCCRAFRRARDAGALFWIAPYSDTATKLAVAAVCIPCAELGDGEIEAAGIASLRRTWPGITVVTVSGERGTA